jgi:hypothetical protein
MALIQVDVVGLKQAAWRNWINLVVVVEVIAAFAVGLLVEMVTTGNGPLFDCVLGRSRYQRPFAWRFPWRTCWLPLFMMTAPFVKVAMQP